MRRPRHLLLPMSVLAWSAAAQAHAGHEETSGWFGDPLVETLIGSLVVLFLAGLAALIRAGRQGVWRTLPPWRLAAFAGGVLTLIVALVSPLDGAADHSFTIHMAQHLLLMLIAAPLFAWSNAHLVIIRAVPVGARRTIGRAIAGIPGVRQGAHSGTAPWLALLCFSAAMLLWHLPGAYDRALESDTVHTAEHLCFLITSTAFWRVIGTAGDRRLSLGMSVLMVSLVGLEGALLAALITFSPRPLYAAYANVPDALPDQIMAGVLMWIPASLIYLGSTVVALRRLLQPSRRIQRA